MRIYLRKRRLCESRAAVRTDIPSGGSPEFVMLQEFWLLRFPSAALFKISVICSACRAVFVGYAIYNFKETNTWKTYMRERQKEKTDTWLSTYLPV